MTPGEHDNKHGHDDHPDGVLSTASHATLHCLLGCTIGEVLGVVAGTVLGFGTMGRMVAGTVLAFIFGLNLAVLPLMKREHMKYTVALKTIFWGEIASIAAMEIAMNGADYLFGGIQSELSAWRFWAGFVIMLPAGYLAALPVNYVLIKTAVKDHHH